jgi:hypothetical protein
MLYRAAEQSESFQCGLTRELGGLQVVWTPDQTEQTFGLSDLIGRIASCQPKYPSVLTIQIAKACVDIPVRDRSG